MTTVSQMLAELAADQYRESKIAQEMVSASQSAMQAFAKQAQLAIAQLNALALPNLNSIVQPINDSAILQMNQLIEQNEELARQMFAGLQGPEIDLSILNIANQLTDSFNEIQKSSFASILSETVELIDLTEKVFDNRFFKWVEENFNRQKIEFFIQIGWPIAPSMDLELLESLYTLEEEGKANYAGNTIRGYYRSDNFNRLERMTKGWIANPFFSKRGKIIGDCYQAHLECKYTLSIPVLLSQIEGILSDYVKKYQLQATVGKINQISEAVCGKNLDLSRAENVLRDGLRRFFQEYIFHFVDFNRPIPQDRHFENNRHMILHGLSINYASQTNSLKNLLVLDVISEITA